MNVADKEAFERWVNNDSNFDKDGDTVSDLRNSYAFGLSRGREEVENIRIVIKELMGEWAEIHPSSIKWKAASDKMIAFKQVLAMFPPKPEESKVKE